MNKEKYKDPTADTAIGHVALEERRKKQGKEKGVLQRGKCEKLKKGESSNTV